MNSNDLFDVIGETPERYVLDAENAQAKTASIRERIPSRKDASHEPDCVENADMITPLHARKRISFAILIAAIICLLAVAAVATTITLSTGDWFTSFFGYGTQEEAKSELTENQSEILHTGLVEINQSVTNQGYTVTLESGLCDGYRTLIRCRIDAPNGVILNGRNYGLDYTNNIDSSSGVPWDCTAATYSSYLLEDDDPNDNSISVLLDIELQPSKDSDISMADGTTWTITIINILELTGDDEQAAWNSLCEGTWEFQVAFEDELVVTKSVELLDKPVRCDSTMFINNWLIRSKRLPLKATLFSFELRSLSATIRCNRPLIATFEGIDLEGPLYLVMKDGSRVEVDFGGSIYRKDHDEIFCTFDRPVSVEEVEYIEFPGVGKVAVSGKESNKEISGTMAEELPAKGE